ncbi:MAG: type II secretion system F family protein [Gammaproteobacteria bacterium]
MEYLYQLFTMVAGDAGSKGWVFSVMVGIAAVLFTMSVLIAVGGVFDPVRQRLRGISGSGQKGQVSAGFTNAIKPLAPFMLPKHRAERTNTRLQLVQAGYASSDALEHFYAIKLLLALGFAAVVFIGATVFPGFNTTQVITAALSGAVAGLFLPSILLSRRIEARKRSLRHALPDALDLLVTCTEAGAGLNSALLRVADELAISHPVLAQELSLVNAEIRAGVDRGDALRSFADRTGLDDIRGLVSLLNQSMRFGTSIADTLRIYSEEYRDKRMQAAEEQAAKIATKLIFPLVLCLWPSFFVVAVGPAVIAIAKAFAQLTK